MSLSARISREEEKSLDLIQVKPYWIPNYNIQRKVFLRGLKVRTGPLLGVSGILLCSFSRWLERSGKGKVKITDF